MDDKPLVSPDPGTDLNLDLSGSKMPVLFELSGNDRRDPLGLTNNPVEMAKQSAEALTDAMHAIEGMASRTLDTIHRLDRPPDELELEFGIKMDAKLGAIVSSDCRDAALHVKLTWHRDRGDS